MVRIIIDNLPLLIFNVLLGVMSILYNLEKDEKVESNVAPAEVTMIKFMSNNITGPKNLATSTVAWPCIPFVNPKIPTTPNNVIQVIPIKVAKMKDFKVVFGEKSTCGSHEQCTGPTE